MLCECVLANQTAERLRRPCCHYLLTRRHISSLPSSHFVCIKNWHNLKERAFQLEFEFVSSLCLPLVECGMREPQSDHEIEAAG